MTDRLPVSVEGLEDLCYNAAAWLRDLDLSDTPAEWDNISIDIRYVDHAIIDLIDGSENLYDGPAEITMRVLRFRDEPDGLHVHAGPYCASVDMAKLAEHRPVKP